MRAFCSRIVKNEPRETVKYVDRPRREKGKRNRGYKKTESCCALGDLPFRIESVLESQ